MTITKTLPFSDETITEAARLILAGAPVAVATETVYGLAADATNADAVARIYEAKGRPGFNPLIVHVPNLAAAERIGEFDELARSRRGALARPADARRSTTRGRRYCFDRHRRPHNNRPTSARAPRHTGVAEGGGTPARRTVGQCQRRDQSDPRRACDEKPGRPNSADRRFRTYAARN